MQRFLTWMRHLVYPAAAILLLWAAYEVLASPYVSQSKGKILVVYNGDSTAQNCTDDITPDEENESEEALVGLCKAIPKNGPALDLLNLHAELEGQSDVKSTKIYQQLASRVARGSVLGVISLLTSPDSPPVVRFCRTMEIPLLLTVAANDDLMGPAEDTRGIVFRMMPTNGRQASNIANWIQGRLRKDQRLRLGVFHEPNSFGEFLQRQLAHELKPQVKDKEIILYNFEVTEQLEFADLMPQLWCANIDLIVYLGFPSHGLDLLNKLKGYRADEDQVSCRPHDPSRSFDHLTVLLSSGAYQQDLNDKEKYIFPFQVFAMLPTNPVADAAQDSDISEGFQYGYDSYALLGTLAAEGFKIPSQPLEHTKTGHDYRFDENGELKPLEKNSYRAYLLASSFPARKP